MSIVNFVKTESPCVRNEVIAWHQAHGWVWNCEYRGVAFGVFYCTLLGGDGVVCHFETCPHIQVPPAAILGGFRKGTMMVEHAVNVVLATIPAEKEKLIRAACHLGFRKVSRYVRENRNVWLLQYFGR